MRDFIFLVFNFEVFNVLVFLRNPQKIYNNLFISDISTSPFLFILFACPFPWNRVSPLARLFCPSFPIPQKALPGKDFVSSLLSLACWYPLPFQSFCSVDTEFSFPSICKTRPKSGVYRLIGVLLLEKVFSYFFNRNLCPTFITV